MASSLKAEIIALMLLNKHFWSQCHHQAEQHPVPQDMVKVDVQTNCKHTLNMNLPTVTSKSVSAYIYTTS